MPTSEMPFIPVDCVPPFEIRKKYPLKSIANTGLSF